jgi:hypothetical protein
LTPAGAMSSQPFNHLLLEREWRSRFRFLRSFVKW